MGLDRHLNHFVVIGLCLCRYNPQVSCAVCELKAYRRQGTEFEDEKVRRLKFSASM